MNDRTESAALERARAGDADAFGELVQRHQEVAFRAAYLIVRDAQAAEDVAQEAFVRAYRRLDRFDPQRPFRPWLLRIATNLALNEVRSRGRRHGLFERAVRAVPWRQREPEAQPELMAVADELREDLLHAVGELREEDRIVLYLRYFLDLPEAEIADAIGQRPGTVKSRLSRARGRLRQVVEARYPQLVPESLASSAYRKEEHDA